jgi:hypothetical protein
LLKAARQRPNGVSRNQNIGVDIDSRKAERGLIPQIESVCLACDVGFDNSIRRNVAPRNLGGIVGASVTNDDYLHAVCVIGPSS